MQPVVNALLDAWPDGDPWLRKIWEMASLTRPGVAMPPPGDVGRLRPEDTPADAPSRQGKVYERTVAPPLAFLQWLLQNPDRLQVRDGVSFGAKSPDTIAWRRKLLSGDPKQVEEAQAEARRQLSKRLGVHGRGKWWAFEGFTNVDCCLVTDRCVVFIEGKRTDVLSDSTLWYVGRSQLWRNVEAARELAAGKEFGVVLAVEEGDQGQTAVELADRTLSDSYPHLSPADQQNLNRHFLGFVTWADIVSEFNLPPDCMVERLS
jgi:hypothetical protein